MQGQKQQKWPTIARLLIFLLALLLILTGGFIWVRDSLGSETNLFTAIFAVGGVAVGLFQLIPLLKSSQTPTSQMPVVPPPALPDVHVTIHNTPPAAQPPPPTIPDIYRGIASQPPSTNPRTIQQRENVVKDVYAKLTQPMASALVLVGIGGLGKSTLATLVYNYAVNPHIKLVEEYNYAGDSWLSLFSAIPLGRRNELSC